MAEAEALKLPKPIPCDIRPELLNFTSDRRWDLLGFVRPDEVEEVKAYNLDADGNRYYLVQWKDTWKSESSLIYCEKLLQQFWERKSNALLHQDSLCLPTNASQSTVIEKSNTLHDQNSLCLPSTTSQNTIAEKSNTLDSLSLPAASLQNTADKSASNIDILNALEQEVVASATQPFPSDNVILLPSLQQPFEQAIRNKTENSESNGGLAPTIKKDVGDAASTSVSTPYEKDIDLLIAKSLEKYSNKPENDDGKLPDLKTVDRRRSEEELAKKLDDDQDNDAEQIVIDELSSGESPNADEILSETETVAEPEKQTRLRTPRKRLQSKSESAAKEDETNDKELSSSESPSKKGASKRKIRPPRQSVHTTPVKRTNKGRKAKDNDRKQTGKGSKISKTVSTVITNTATPPKNIKDNNNTDNENDEAAGESTKFKCMVCDKHLTTKQNLMKHLLTHNNNHTCQVCMKTFKSTHFLKHHMDKHNATYEYACPVCNKKFKFKNNMRGHLRKHTMEKKFECEICHKKFMGRYNLKEHMKAHSDNRPFECDFCRKTYKDKGALNKHLLSHQDKKVECEVCKKQFKDAAQVKRHMQFHMSWPGDSFKRKVTTNIGPDGEKLKYKCKFCDKVFNHYSNMNAHINKAHKEKKVQCKQCSKMFAYQYELREHMFVHQNGGVESKFKCQFCEKYFQRSTTLKNHEQTIHLGIKRFKCDVCHKQFGTKFNMKVHIEKLHNKDNEEDSTTTAEQPRRTRVAARDKSRDEMGLMPTEPSMLLPPPNAVPGMVSSQVSLTTPLLRNMNTSDIIRDAIANIPELTYFPGFSSRGYQFYGIPPPEF